MACSININLNFDPEKLEKAMDSFLDEIGYSKKDKKIPTLKLFSKVQEPLYIRALSNSLFAEEESELERIKKSIRENHKFLESYYENHTIGESLEGTIKIINEEKVKEKEEIKKLKETIKKQNELREKFYKEFAKENGKESEEAVKQVKEVFIKKTLERAEENKWCFEKKDKNDNIKWFCPTKK